MSTRLGSSVIQTRAEPPGSVGHGESWPPGPIAGPLRRACSQGAPATLILLDLDWFGEINEIHGDAVGDALLHQVRDRLAECLGPEDAVARLYDDEFAIVRVGGDGLASAVRTAQAVLAAVERPFDVLGRTVRLSASLGVAVFPLHAEDPVALFGLALHAMLRAKYAGRGMYEVARPRSRW
ncbi:MAG: GGDEF domain-containing protein [Deltaproteobacteria bacterium]|nr:GGDEF domain-containing protein [Deltaproteobacteria bacterium]